MTHSPFFTTKENIALEIQVLNFLNAKVNDFPQSTLRSPRAVGDIAQAMVSENFERIAPAGLISRYSATFARRAMADLAFEDRDNYYYVIDVKTHLRSAKFNMPNLTSVERLARFYEDDRNYFVIMLLAYDVSASGLRFERVNFVPIEFLTWNCLTIGALGWGQIQIANSNMVEITPLFSRRAWMLEMCHTLLEFYPREISKIGERIAYFEAVRSRWEARTD